MILANDLSNQSSQLMRPNPRCSGHPGPGSLDGDWNAAFIPTSTDSAFLPFVASRHASSCISTHAYTCAESGGSWRASERGEEAHDGRTRGVTSGRRGARRQSDSESVDSGVAQQVISMRDAHSLTQPRRQHERKTVTTASHYRQV